MVKKILNTVVLVLFAARLILFDWESGLPEVLNAVSVVVLSVAAGIAISNLIGGAKE